VLRKTPPPSNVPDTPVKERELSGESANPQERRKRGKNFKKGGRIPGASVIDKRRKVEKTRTRIAKVIPSIRRRDSSWKRGLSSRKSSEEKEKTSKKKKTQMSVGGYGDQGGIQ